MEMVAELILAIELITIAVGFKLIYKSLTHFGLIKKLGIIFGIFIVITSIILFGTTTFYTIKDGRIVNLSKIESKMESIKDKHIDEENIDEQDSMIPKGEQTGGACAID
jgi:hypothetical protein